MGPARAIVVLLGRVAVACLALAAGCADNAFLEVKVCLPERSTTEELNFAFVQVYEFDSTVSFEAEYSTPDDFSVPLLAGSPTTTNMSLESDKAGVDIAVRVRYCRTEACSLGSEPSLIYRAFSVARPFAIGERRRTTLNAERIPGPGDAMTTLAYTCSGRSCRPEGASEVPRCGVSEDDAGLEDAGDLPDSGN